jgi:hypothetical protein
VPGVVVVVSGDVAVTRGGSGCNGRGWGAVGLPCSESRRFGGAGGRFGAGAGEGVVVVVVDDTGVIRELGRDV